jgi:hypothetical protein
MAIRLNDAIRTGIVDSGIVGMLGTSGILKIYNTPQPPAGGEATTSNLIVTISGISWNPATNGTGLISGTKTGTAGATAGTAAWGRLSGTDGSTYLVDGNCGTAATCDFVINAVAIAASSVVSLTAATIVQPAS